MPSLMFLLMNLTLVPASAQLLANPALLDFTSLILQSVILAARYRSSPDDEQGLLGRGDSVQTNADPVKTPGSEARTAVPVAFMANSNGGNPCAYYMRLSVANTCELYWGLSGAAFGWPLC
jgi:hypothetical protein